MEHLRENFPVWAENRYIGAAGIIVLSIIAAAIVDFIVTRFCRALTRRTETTLDDRFIELMHKPVRSTVLLLGLWMATAQLALPPKPEMIVAAVIKTIMLVIWTVFALRFFGMLLANLSRSRNAKMVLPSTAALFDNLARVVVFGAAIYFVFVFWGIDVSAWLASAGIIGIAVGFAAKDTLANLISGISILADAPYKVGDYINLDTGERGRVEHIGLRSTRLLTRDDLEVTIPNAVIGNAKIVNESGGHWERQRIRVKVSVAYGSDVDHLREVLMDVARNHPDTCDNPEPRVRFRAFGDSSLDFELLCWIEEPVLRGRVLDALLGEVYKRLGAEGIEIPYPKRDVYIREMPGPIDRDRT
jgi:small-conductance mechanosensitive channel